MSEELEEVVASDESDDDAADEDLEEVRVALKPRCNLMASVKEFRTNGKIGVVGLDIWRNWLNEAVEDEVYALFDSIGQTPALWSLSLTSKGSATQILPVSYLSHCLSEANGLRELHLLHIKWTGDQDEFDVLAATLGEHPNLRLWQLHVESMDVLEPAIAAAGHCVTLKEMEIQTAEPAHDKEGLASALQSLCTSKSLKILKLIHVCTKFETLESVAELLSVNEALQELYVEATELDLPGGMAMAKMLATNRCLQKITMKVTQMHAKQLDAAFVSALEGNDVLQYFQIIVDGRMSDMKVVRSMQVMFRDKLKANYKVTSQPGLLMGVTCQRK